MRTIGGACGSVAQASAPSQLSVELWVLRMSTAARLRRQPAAQRDEAGQAFPPDRQRHDGEPHLHARGRDRRFGRRDQRDPVPALLHPPRLGQDADLLPAPTAGVLGVDDRKRCGHEREVGLAVRQRGRHRRQRGAGPQVVGKEAGDAAHGGVAPRCPFEGRPRSGPRCGQATTAQGRLIIAQGDSAAMAVSSGVRAAKGAVPATMAPRLRREGVMKSRESFRRRYPAPGRTRPRGGRRANFDAPQARARRDG